ncbi:MAG: hypothetical protein JNL11_13900 [Bdellovibrionaceae bacterium]|nr:hypothetical protein [Pseudobdellovibrionaceae bacterium]
MFFKEYKLEILVGSSLALVFVYLFYQMMTIKPRKISPADKISFEMIRPQQDVINEFTLDGREVDSRFENPFVKKDLHKDTNRMNTPKFVPIKKTADKKKEKSKADDKKKKGLDVNIVSRDVSGPRHSESDENYYQRYNPQNSQSGHQNTNKNNNKNDTTKNDDENKKKSISEFVDLLTDPKPERITAFVNAIKSNEFEISQVYSFMGKMLVSDKPQVQSVGVYVAYYIPTVESFTLVVTNQDKLSPEVKTYSDQFLTSFNQPSKLPVLAQALQSSDIKVVTKAGELVIFGLQNIKKGQTIDYGARSNRGNNEVKSESFLGYFLPIADALKSNPDQTIASLGAALSQQLSQISKTP